MTYLEAASAYAARGLYVLPCHGITAGACDCGKPACRSPGKHPLNTNGLKSATTDTIKIKEWWTRWPNANVAIRTGIDSGMIVLDVDGPEGEDFLKSKHLPTTPISKTGRGRHIFFKHPGEIVKNAVKTVPQLDVRGDGGYVVAPPSKHRSGKVYSWVEDFSLEDKPLAEVPTWILDLLKPKPVSSADAVQSAGTDETIPEGKRNDTLTKLAGKLRRNGLGEDAIFAALSAENARRCSPLLNEAEVRAIAASIAKKPAGAIDRDDGPTVAQALVKIGERAQLFHDERSTAHAVVVGEKGQRIMAVRGRDFRMWLARAYYLETRKAANGEALGAALQLLEAQAVHSGEKIPLWNRFARLDGAVWLDLADEAGRAVKVTAEGWTVVERPPVLFRRFSHQAPLPVPEKGGHLRELLDFLNIAREEDKLLVLSWLVTALLADIPRPALILHGAQGSAKTTAARMCRALLDPSAIVSVSLRRDDGELAQVLDHHASPLFDNLSGIGAAQADLLCQAVTGGGFSKRGLYTDDEDRLFSFKRAMILTGITVPTTAPDLLERSLLIELERVGPEKRREESDLWRSFEAIRPRLLDGLLDALAEAMRVYPTIRFDRLPRMADFCTWGAAAAEAMGFGSLAFVRALALNAETQRDEVISSSPVAAAIREFAGKEGSWEGTPSELYKKFTPDKPRQGDGWPKSASALSKALRRLQTPLADAGVRVTFPDGKDDKGHNSRGVKIEAVSARQMPSLPSLPSRPDGKEARHQGGAPDSIVSAAVSNSAEKIGPETAETAETAKDGDLRGGTDTYELGLDPELVSDVGVAHGA